MPPASTVLVHKKGGGEPRPSPTLLRSPFVVHRTRNGVDHLVDELRR